jgi:hypothetical protein
VAIGGKIKVVNNLIWDKLNKEWNEMAKWGSSTFRT